MSDGLASRLSYILESVSVSEVSRAIGIPRSTLQYDIAHDVPLASQYQKELYNLYSRTAYGNLREEGFSSTNARRFSSYTVEHLTKNIGLMREKIDQFALGWLESDERRSGRTWTNAERAAYLEKKKPVLRELLAKSKAPFEDIIERDIT